MATQNLLLSTQEFSLEFRVRFPGPDSTDMPPTELSGAIATLTSGSSASSYLSLWYEKPALTSLTGNLFVTSSAGRFDVVSGSIFNDQFYNIALVKERSTGSLAVYVDRADDGVIVYTTSSLVLTGSTGCPSPTDYNRLELGSSVVNPSRPEFWGHEFRLWQSALSRTELDAHAKHFECYGRDVSYTNYDLLVHCRLSEGTTADASGIIPIVDSTLAHLTGTASGNIAFTSPYDKFLESFAYVSNIEYGWNQEKVRIIDGSVITPDDAYHDERFVSLEFNMYDALNEDIAHLVSSYDELTNFLGLPVNRYRFEYEGLQQMRETYFKRLQGKLNFRVFVDMLDFFDTSFISIVERLLPARALFKGDELVVESHMLERPKYQYQLRPVREGMIDISGSISVVDRDEDYYD